MKTWRTCLIVLGFFIALNALGGSIAMLLDTSGKLMDMEILLPYIPFASFLIPALVLLFCVALPHFILVFMAIKKLPLSAWFGVICGILLLIWLIVEICYIGFTVLAVIFLVLALAEIVFALLYKNAFMKQKRILSGGILR